MTPLAATRDDLDWYLGQIVWHADLVADTRHRLATVIGYRDEQADSDRRAGEPLWCAGPRSQSYVSLWQRRVDEHARDLACREAELDRAVAAAVAAAQRFARVAVEAECGPCRTCGGTGEVVTCVSASHCSHVNDRSEVCHCQLRDAA